MAKEHIRLRTIILEVVTKAMFGKTFKYLYEEGANGLSIFSFVSTGIELKTLVLVKVIEAKLKVVLINSHTRS